MKKVSFFKPFLTFILLLVLMGGVGFANEDQPISIPESSNANELKIPGGKGKLTSNTWRSTSGKKQGNTIQWNYQVSAVYSGNRAVEYIKTSWKASASLRKSASINLGISGSGASAGTSQSWQYVSTPRKSWMNTKGQKISDYRSNVVISPHKDYRTNTISVTNTSTVKLKGDAKPYSISSGA